MKILSLIFLQVLLYTMNPFLKKQLTRKIDSKNFTILATFSVFLITFVYFIHAVYNDNMYYKLKDDLGNFSKADYLKLFSTAFISFVGARILAYILSLDVDVSYVTNNVQPMVIVATALVEYFFFNKALTKQKLTSLTLIVGGLILQNYGKEKKN